jgi:hypothetical protein
VLVTSHDERNTVARYFRFSKVGYGVVQCNAMRQYADLRNGVRLDACLVQVWCTFCAYGAYGADGH